MVINERKFEVGEDVVITVCGCEFKGYIFSFAEAESMALVKQHDGKDSEWVHCEDLRHNVYIADVALPGGECE